MLTVWPLALSRLTRSTWMTHLGRADADVDGLAVGLVAAHALDVDDPLLAVDLRDLALPVVVVAADDRDLVVLTDRQRPHVVLGAELLRERRRHELLALHRRGREVGLALLAARGRDVRAVLHG